MKQNPAPNAIGCPIQCPVCHHDGKKFPAKFYHIELISQGLELRMDSAKANHIIFLIHGALRIEDGQRELFLMEGQCLFIPRSALPRIAAAKPAKIVCLDFSNRIALGGQDCLKKIAATPAKNRSFDIPVLLMTENVRQIVLTDIKFESPCWHMIKQYELFFALYNDYSPDELAGFFANAIHAADDFRLFVANNYKEGDTLDDIARKANLSKNYFAQRFKANFGMTPYQWLMKQKSEKLRQLAAAGCHDTKLIVDKLGFKNPTGLYLFCKRNIGCTFSELIRKCRNDVTKTSQN